MKSTKLHILLSTLLLLFLSATASALCTVFPDSLNFSSAVVGNQLTKTLVLTNDGATSVSGTLTFSSGNNFYFGSGNNTYGYILAPGTADTVIVHLTSSYGGQHNAQIDLGTIGADCDLPFVPCYGYGMYPSEPGVGECSLSPSLTFLFPSITVGQETTESFHVTNTTGVWPNPYTGVVEGVLPTHLGDFHIPWGGPFAVTTYQWWDVNWQPTTPGWHSEFLQIPGMCGDEYPIEFKGLALIDGLACDISVSDLDLGFVSVGDTAYGTITIQNLGNELLSFTIPESCGPFDIVEIPQVRVIAPEIQVTLHIEFTPTEPGLQNCTLDLGQDVCDTVQLTGVGLDGTGVPDQLGIWFEQSGTINSAETTTPFETVTAYLMIRNPSTPWGALGWECCVEMVGEGIGLSWDLAGSALNVEPEPCFSVGMQSGALMGSNVIVLATLTYIQPDPDSPTFFFVHPVASPSIPGTALYANGANPGHLIPLTPASGAETVPVAMVNAPTTDVPEVSRRTAITSAHPNPFNPSTTLAFELARSGHTRLAIHDMRGRLVRTLVDGNVSDGAHEKVWDGRSDTGRSVESGVYFARLTSGNEHTMMKVMLLK